MPTDDALRSLLDALLTSSHVERAATAVLRVTLSDVAEALAASDYAGRGRLLRGMVHLRPDGYRCLIVAEHPPGSASSSPGLLPSATAWRWVAEHRCPVSIDVHLGVLRTWLAADPGAPVGGGAAALLDSRETRNRLLERDATHVHVVPLRTSRGAVEGMISIEASCQAAIGKPFVWPACNERLQIVADVAAPRLAALPLELASAAQPDAFLPVVGAATAGLVEVLRVFAQQAETVLISGPTGAGKSRLARLCHERSARAAGRFETVNLLSVPEELQMGELFGWRRGAFTGAMKDNPGAVARAEKGTLFIDEIDKLSLKAQAGLLHVLEERTYRPMGEGAAERAADVRFVIGTNADLRAAVHAGRFREDLYYRINVLPVRVPPLAERLDELPRWADHMLSRRHQEGGGLGEARLSQGALDLLLASAWPGNLRQLDNIVRRAYALALVDRAGAREGLLLERRHVERALGYDGASDAAPLVDLLRRAASAFVSEAERRDRAGAPISLDLADAFRGIVLGAAVQRLGDRDAAFRVLGQPHLVKNRNHHRALRRELRRAAELVATLGEAEHRAIADLLEDERE
jgi:DNA-binding NtrC family response regulator